jgi:hypothetical protein
MFYWLRPLLHNAYWGGWLAMAGSLDHFLSGGGRDRESVRVEAALRVSQRHLAIRGHSGEKTGCGLELQWDAVDIASCLIG